MILKRMAELCKKNKQVMIVRTGEGKFLSNGVVMARTNDEWGLDDYFVMLEDEQEAYHSTVMDCTNNVDEISEAEALRFRVVIYGDELQPFKVDDEKIIYIKTRYLRVFDETDDKIFEFCSDGYFKNALRIRNNFGIMGYIFPVKLQQSELKEFAADVYAGAKFALDNGFMALPEQESMF